MNKFKILFVFLLALGQFAAVSQQNTDEYEYKVKKKKMTAARKNKMAVSKAIKQLKEGGAVIYMIKDRKVKTDAMKERGMEAQAIQLENERMAKQKIIVKGLYENFNFCPVYFVFQSDFEKVVNGEMEGNFVDTTMQKNASIKFNHAYFLVLDYGNVYDEQGKVYCDTCKSDVTGKMSLKTDAFVFKNKYLSQLTKPFPYFITCHYPKKEIAVRMKVLNKRLKTFYAKVSE